MKPNTKLQTPFSFQLFDYLKQHLYNFYPGSIIKPETKNNKPLKASFHYIIHLIAGGRPAFLTDYIYQTNPNIDKEATIPFNILETTFKKILYKFTTILFTQFNYAEIFASSITIPSYKPAN